VVAILGASGAGKSSFLRAGLLPRLARESQHFLPLPIIRPERAILSGETGLIVSLEKTAGGAGLGWTRANIRKAARRAERSARTLTIEEPLIDALLADIEKGGGKDALPLLAFTLERLYREARGAGRQGRDGRAGPGAAERSRTTSQADRHRARGTPAQGPLGRRLAPR
jgi:hypothetical protein